MLINSTVFTRMHHYLFVNANFDRCVICEMAKFLKTVYNAHKNLKIAVVSMTFCIFSYNVYQTINIFKMERNEYERLVNCLLW